MANEKTENTTQQSDKKDDVFKNAPETLNTTDPQEHMEGPLSSLMQMGKDSAKKNDEKDKNEGKE